MNREVFIDASAWIAVSDSRDKFHLTAAEEHRQLLLDRRIFVTTNLVIAEAYILIRRTGGHVPAISFLSALRGSPRLVKIYSDASMEAEAEELLEKHADQDYSFADAVSFVVMQDRGIEQAFTFDGHFAGMGFQMLPVPNK